MCLADKAEAEIEMMPLPKEIADQLWKTSRHRYTVADFGYIRVLQGSPLEDALHFLRTRTSAQTSAETSDVERRKRHRDESDKKVGEKEETETDREVQEKIRATWQTRPMPEFRPRQPKDHGKYKSGVLS
jgi:hypothetical protein